MENNNEKFLALVRHPLKFKLFMLLKLPSAFFCGVRVKSIDINSATVTVPFKWLSQNPFKSTYFACLAMAAEMSTGLLSMIHTYESTPSVSMLVTGLQATYHKKATGLTLFTCNDGEQIANIIKKAITTKEPQNFTATAIGIDESGQAIATFLITWSFKAKAV
jgi:hypothetical protein